MRRALLTATAKVVDPLAGINIGDSFMGGYYAGIIDTTRPGSIIAADANQSGLRYALIVAPKSLENAALAYKTANTAAPASALTRWDGLSATSAMNSATYPAAQWCAGRTAPSDAASAWYLPAMDELEILYRNFKPTTNSNSTSGASATFPGFQTPGVNPSSDPTGTAYSTVPAQTAVVAFRSGGSEALEGSGLYWSATEGAATTAWAQAFPGNPAGGPAAVSKTITGAARPVRRLLL